ncbi:MAG: hypothetical protein H7A41_08205 [Chlamydiales bacterium]|nr:hypothetical protein [Chlamydiales bacterium]
MERREILNEIDETLDQLIKNAAALKEITSDPLYQTEIEALQKMQESLLARLLHLDRFLKGKSENKTEKSIYDKLTIFSELSSTIAKQVRSSYPKPQARRKKSRACSNHSNV